MIKTLFSAIALVAALSTASFVSASTVPAYSTAKNGSAADDAKAVLLQAQGNWSALSRTAVAITGGVRLKDNVLIFNGNTRYAIEPTSRVGQTGAPGSSLEVDGVPFFRLRLISQDSKAGKGLRGARYLRDGNPLCGDNDSYLYAQIETLALGGVENAVLAVRIFEPPKKGAHGRPHYCAAYNYLKQLDSPNTSG